MMNMEFMNSIRSVGILKPYFDVKEQMFKDAELNILGTGFWLEGAVFITCAHVVDKLIGDVNEVGLLVVGGNGKDYKRATIAVIDHVRDLAVLTIREDTDQVKCTSISSEPEIVGQDIYYAGYPLGKKLVNELHTPIFSRGVIGHQSTDFGKRRKEIKISGNVVGGFSGSPVVNADGKLVGVLSNGPAETQSIFNIISYEHVAALRALILS